MGIFDFVKEAGEGLKDKVLGDDGADLSLIHISEPTRPTRASRMPSAA